MWLLLFLDWDWLELLLHDPHRQQWNSKFACAQQISALISGSNQPSHSPYTFCIVLFLFTYVLCHTLYYFRFVFVFAFSFQMGFQRASKWFWNGSWMASEWLPNGSHLTSLGFHFAGSVLYSLFFILLEPVASLAAAKDPKERKNHTHTHIQKKRSTLWEPIKKCLPTLARTNPPPPMLIEFSFNPPFLLWNVYMRCARFWYHPYPPPSPRSSLRALNIITYLRVYLFWFSFFSFSGNKRRSFFSLCVRFLDPLAYTYPLLCVNIGR